MKNTGVFVCIIFISSLLFFSVIEVFPELLDKINQAMALDDENRTILQQKQAILEHLKQLTPREVDVMKLMVEGKANKVIAIDLDISQRTVEIHRARVMEKLCANSLAHLVRMFLAVESEMNAKDS